MEDFGANLYELYRLLVNDYPNIASELFDGLELLHESIDIGITEVSKKIGELSTSRKFGDAQTLLDIVERMKSTENLIAEYLNKCLELSTEESEESVEYDELEDEEDEKLIPNYADYKVDSRIPHSIVGENFTHKKICGFSLNGKYYEVEYWKYTLKKICEILYESDSEKFRQLLSSGKFVGKKVKYISYERNGEYSLRLHNAKDIYVWANLSAASICDIIRNLLKEFNIPSRYLSIYLRADYTALHNTVGDDKKGEKIGKHVRDVLNNLSEANYQFEPEMLEKLLNKNETKSMFGIGLPFLKEVDSSIDISTQCKDENGYNRYWKTPFRFNGKNYLVVSQWMTINAERFEKWYSGLPNVQDK